MKIGVLSDTHLHQVTRKFQDIYEGCLSDMDLILHAGDVVTPDVIDFLNAKSFHGVAGNMDPPILHEILPAKKVLEIAGYRVGLIHGWGPAEGLEDRILSVFSDVDIIVYGHSHVPANHIREGILLFNPGTATGYSATGEHSIGILRLEKEEARGEIIYL